ncbi:keratin-associated protein 9-1-like [Halichondria panicea]|uniref:keratin-associated protein 9-1-like n=1 Tax=Halichondria panicea TaxID=6063 RepID=UPI00312B3F4B
MSSINRPLSTSINASPSLTVPTTTTLLTPHTPTPSPPTTPSQVLLLFPAAGVVAIVIAVFLLAVFTLLVIRKCIMYRGKQFPDCPRVCVVCDCCDGCGGWECCRGLCESLDCQPPDCNAWLDNICPTKQRCSLFCTGLVSCYCCVLCMESCQEMQICPDCSAMTCPDCDCCNCCHCTVKIPECHQISCLCFECGRPPV